jgi:hypothetical protein
MTNGNPNGGLTENTIVSLGRSGFLLGCKSMRSGRGSQADVGVDLVVID